MATSSYDEIFLAFSINFLTKLESIAVLSHGTTATFTSDLQSGCVDVDWILTLTS